MNNDLHNFLSNPRAFEFLDAVRPYVQQGMTLEQACAKVSKNWQTLLARVSDGVYSEGSRYAPAVNEFCANLANQVWDTVNG